MSKRDEDQAARGGSARYGRGGPATGGNEPKDGEKKEQHEDWVHRQGGDQTRNDGTATTDDEPRRGG